MINFYYHIVNVRLNKIFTQNNLLNIMYISGQTSLKFILEIEYSNYF